MSNEAPRGSDFRMGDDPDYPEPPIESIQGLSKAESDEMNRNQTISEAQDAGRARGRLLEAEEALRQRYARDAAPDAANAIRETQIRRREQR